MRLFGTKHGHRISPVEFVILQVGLVFGKISCEVY